VRDRDWDAIAERSRAVFGEFSDRTDPDLRKYVCAPAQKSLRSGGIADFAAAFCHWARVVELYTQDSFEGVV